MNLLESNLSYWDHLKTINPTDASNGGTKLSSVFSVVSQDLIKKLKLAVIQNETLGKTLNRNDKLKRSYLYSYKSF
jgi:hypothetical protein